MPSTHGRDGPNVPGAFDLRGPADSQRPISQLNRCRYLMQPDVREAELHPVEVGLLAHGAGLTASDFNAGCVPFLRADSPAELADAIREH
jgi:hypothetical protein